LVTLSGTYPDDAYISTKDRLNLSVDSNNLLEVVVGYKLGNGNGAESGNAENIYIYLEGVEQGFSETGAYSRLYIPSTPLTTNTVSYVGVVGGSSNTLVLGTGVNRYEGEIRIYVDFDSSRVYCGYRASPGDSWSGPYLTFSPTTAGNYFKIKLLVDKDSSDFHVNYFYVNRGTSNYYTNTPKVTGVYEQKLLEISDIYPNNYKNVYVKTYVDRNLDIESEHEMDMKVRWRIASY
jgi:hypothetical protein